MKMRTRRSEVRRQGCDIQIENSYITFRGHEDRAHYDSCADYEGQEGHEIGSELEDPFRDENSQILHCRQSLLMNTSLSDHTKAASLFSPLHQVPTSFLDYASSRLNSTVNQPTKVLTRSVG